MPINFDYAAFFLCIEANSCLFGPHIFLRALKRSIMTKGDKSYNTVSAGCLGAYIPNISSEGWLEKTSQGHHLTLGWVRISLAKWNSEGAMGLVCPTGWVITLKLQRVLPRTMSVP